MKHLFCDQSMKHVCDQSMKHVCDQSIKHLFLTIPKQYLPDQFMFMCDLYNIVYIGLTRYVQKHGRC